MIAHAQKFLGHYLSFKIKMLTYRVQTKGFEKTLTNVLSLVKRKYSKKKK